MTKCMDKWISESIATAFGCSIAGTTSMQTTTTPQIHKDIFNMIVRGNAFTVDTRKLDRGMAQSINIKTGDLFSVELRTSQSTVSDGAVCSAELVLSGIEPDA